MIMADEKDKPQARSASALNELMEGAKALQAIQAQAAQDAMRLPEPRLDEAQEGHYFLASDGETKIDANGMPMKDKKD
jgi:hypothetical protein